MIVATLKLKEAGIKYHQQLIYIT